METFENLTEQNTEEQSTSSQAAFRANLFPPPDEDEERKTTASSGLKCYELYEKSSQHGSLLKTCVASLVSREDWYSSVCALNWKKLATKSNRFVFQLAPSVRRTEGKEFGLLLTPRASEGETSVKTFRKRMGDHPNSYPSLHAQLNSLLPTVRTSSANGASAAEVAAGNPKCRLETEIAMLPTPSSRDWKGKRRALKDGKNTSDTTGIAFGMDLNQAVELGTSRGYKLQPAFAAWMMGFPENYTELPFQGGEKKV